jgi:hypothetical protein
MREMRNPCRSELELETARDATRQVTREPYREARTRSHQYHGDPKVQLGRRVSSVCRLLYGSFDECLKLGGCAAEQTS